ncbi:Zinc finger MYM-type protein 1-like [Oopsacas minuta]|uniref:Zinc finger MYM-type protein 1-like n=1 Tax=Oopsacas minuta TaxID=111878 RepID=A0AAV7JIJ6_9METZ|nr:Zinc finger MYM-type protein 1-like [Oopsacas minuta]
MAPEINIMDFDRSTRRNSRYDGEPYCAIIYTSNANCFCGLIADETSDISRIEQLSISFRTVDSDLSPNERVLGSYALDKCDAESIFSAIKDAPPSPRY